MSDPAADRARALLKANISRLAAGDRGALRDIYQATSAKLFGICLRILGDEREAEDALQDVYLDLWKRADRYDASRASPISWLATMARNRAIDRLRAGGKVACGAVPQEAAANVADGSIPADRQVELDQRDARIHYCLSQLEERQRSAIARAFFTGATYVQLAEEDDVPLSTVKSRVHRGLARLKACIEKE
ncbi:sigma-70 family RNA polymerase sigma factor [Aurantiacibacter hainanensis]|uniref:sigma-70 family RNA polymerase sigma factor n=1 Tax=Aurantiacibacter hainanensis TaxID=3076114 RepID=UPI0030C6DFC6